MKLIHWTVFVILVAISNCSIYINKRVDLASGVLGDFPLLYLFNAMSCIFLYTNLHLN